MLSLEELIALDPTHINIKRSVKNEDILVFKNKQNTVIAKVTYYDFLREIFASESVKWIIRFCQIKPININNPDDCDSETILNRAFCNESLHAIIPKLSKVGARLTASELIWLDEEVMLERSTSCPDELVITKQMIDDVCRIARVNIKELWDLSCQDRKIHWIERLIEECYVSYPDPRKVKPGLHPDFKVGCWVSMVGDVPREILRIRNNDAHLANLSDVSSYSSATFVCPNLKIALYEAGGKAGFIIRQAGRTIPYWYSGLNQEELTRKLSLDELRNKATNSTDGHHFFSLSENVLLGTLDKRITTPSRYFRAGPLDKYHAIKYEKDYAWNEGFIHYQSDDVIGIHYDPNNPRSRNEAIILHKEFKSAFNKELTFFFYTDGQLDRAAQPLQAIEEPVEESFFEGILKMQRKL